MSELIRSFVQVSALFPNSEYRRLLSSVEECVFVDLITQPTWCGVFKYPLAARVWYHASRGATHELIELALAKFEADGKIKRDGEYIWNLAFISHQSFNSNNLKAAMNESLGLAAKTELAAACYQAILQLFKKRFPNLSVSVNTLDYTRLDEKNPQLSSGEAPTGLAEGQAPEAASLEVPSDRDKPFESLALQLIGIVKEAESKWNIKHPAKQNTAKAAAQVRLLVEKDKFKPEELMEVAKWLFLTGPKVSFYIQNLSSVHNWRKAWTNGMAFVCGARDFEAMSATAQGSRQGRERAENSNVGLGR